MSFFVCVGSIYVVESCHHENLSRNTNSHLKRANQLTKQT